MLALLVLLLGSVYYLFEISSTAEALSLLALVAPVAGALVLLLFLLRQIFLRQMAKSLPEELTVAITPEGLLHSDASTQSLTAWNAIEHVGQTPQHLFVVFAKNRGVAIPLRAFKSREDYHAALDALGRHLPNFEIDPPRSR